MTYYHGSKNAALLAGAAYESHWSIKAELVPDNGWVLVLKPKTLEVFNWPLAELLEHAELELGRLGKRPASHKVYTPPPKAEGSTPRGSGATARVHAICDKIHAESPLARKDRAKVMAACTEAGINPATAGTQWAKWCKAHGL